MRPNFTPRRRAQPVGRRQHNPGAPDVLLGAVAVIDDRLQALAISRAQIDADASTHPADSHGQGHGNPNKDSYVGINPLAVVDQIDVASVFTFETENHAPVSRDGHRPKPG